MRPRPTRQCSVTLQRASVLTTPALPLGTPISSLASENDRTSAYCCFSAKLLAHLALFRGKMRTRRIAALLVCLAAPSLLLSQQSPTKKDELPHPKSLEEFQSAARKVLDA